jgi:hypothetical protein
MMARIAKKASVELRPDGWERFKVAVAAAAKTGPKHRPVSSTKKKTKSKATAGAA